MNKNTFKNAIRNFRFERDEIIKEIDFIINYDIKYRMGKELENGEEE